MNNDLSQAETSAFGAAADVAHMMGIVSIALAVDGDAQLRQALRQSAHCTSDESLTLNLPRAPAALVIEPSGVLRPIRTTGAIAGVDLEALISAHPELRKLVPDAQGETGPVAQSLFESFFRPGRLPSRESFEAVLRWGPLIEAPAYRLVARASARLDKWRASALREADAGVVKPAGLISFYFALAHTMAHLTLVCSEHGAGPWLADMAQSFWWTNWTPSFPLVRERTLWLAAAAAKSAAAFGADVVDGYVRAMSDCRHVYKLFDALFGLAAIALTDDHLLGPITDVVSAAQDACVSRITTGAEQAPWMFASAKSLLRRWADDRSVDPAVLRQLGWDTGAGPGLATRQAFRLDPSDIDARNHVLGFSVLPAILQAPPGWHYPRRAPPQSPLLPQRHELAGLLTRAWGAGPAVGQTLH
jgi:hypothetical protein